MKTEVWWCPKLRSDGSGHEHHSRRAAFLCVVGERFRRQFIRPVQGRWWRLIRWFDVTHKMPDEQCNAEAKRWEPKP